jgi:hypothetical protein
LEPGDAVIIHKKVLVRGGKRFSGLSAAVNNRGSRVEMGRRGKLRGIFRFSLVITLPYSA